MWSGGHYLPSSGLSQGRGSVGLPRPTWLGADGTVDPAGVPSSGIPVFDTDGSIACHISLDQYLTLGEDTPVDLVLDLDHPAQEEIQVAVEEGPAHGQPLDGVTAVTPAVMTAC